MRKSMRWMVLSLILLLCLFVSPVLAKGASSITLPEGLMTIEAEAFMGAASLENVYVPEGTTSIGARAFANSSLQYIELPASMESIADDAFEGCDELEVVAPEGSYAAEWWENAPKPAPASDFEYIISNGECTITKYVGNATEVMIPSKIKQCPVTEIGRESFKSCGDLTNIIIPNGVIRIGVSAFEQCRSLISVTIPDSVTYIGDMAFFCCFNLNGVVIPDGVEHIMSSTFGYCESLASIDLPEGVKSIEGSAFGYCSGLSNIVIPQSLNYIGSYAFSACTNLESVILPDESITYIGDGAFSGCISLSDIVISNGVTSIGYDAFRACRSLTSVVISDSVAEIEANAFRYCYNLTSIFIPANVINIHYSVFHDGSGNLTIYGEPGSYAQTYAEGQFISFSSAPMPEKDYGERNLSLSVSVLSPDGTPMGGASIEVLLFGEQTVVKSAKTDANGSVTIDGLQQRAYVLRCTHPAFLYAEQYLYMSETSSQALFKGAVNGEYLAAPMASYSAAQTGDTLRVPVAASGSWTAETTADWLNLAPVSGMPGGELTVTASANTGVLRTGEIVLKSGNLSCSVYVQQAGAQGSRLPNPVITYPITNGDVVAYGPVTVTWNAVEGAGSYVIFLRDLDMDRLLVHHQKMSDQLYTVLDPIYFDDGHQYRVAVGAVPPGGESTDSTVSWCERIFDVSEAVSTEPVIFTGMVYELYDTAAASAAQSRTWNARASSIDFKGARDCKVEVYHFNKTDNENIWEYVTEAFTDDGGRYTITEGLEAGEEYKFIFTKTEYSFIGDIEQLTYTAKSGETQIVDTYCFSTEIKEQVEAFRKIRGFDISGHPNGLWAEYFAYSNKNDAFTARNKRNEEILQSAVDFSWKGETVSNGSWNTKQSYYQLHVYRFDDKKQEDVQSTLNYVPFKFAARFSGYVKLKGADDADTLMRYRFRARGDDGVSLKLELPSYESYAKSQWKNRGLAENEVVVDLGSVGYLNGTVFKVCIEYYNKSNGGDANLIFEYSTDDGQTWKTVPYTWLYRADDRSVSIMDSNETVGVDYAAKLAKSTDKLVNYNDHLVSNMLKDLTTMSVDSAVKAYNIGTVLFGEHQLTSADKFAMFWQQKLGKKAAKAVYTAFYDKVCEIDNEETIWEKISEQMGKQFELKLDTVYNATTTTIDSISTIQSLYAALADNASSNASILAMQSAILENIELYTVGELKDLDSSDETVSAGYSTFFELSGTKRKALENEALKLDVDVKLTWGFADKGFKLLETLWSTDDANTNRAVLAMMFAEKGEVPEMFEASLAMVENDYGETIFSLYEKGNPANPKYNKNRDEFETAMNSLTNKTLNTLYARLQDVDIEELLYKDLLKITLDAAYTYYKNLFKFGL